MERKDKPDLKLIASNGDPSPFAFDSFYDFEIAVLASRGLPSGPVPDAVRRECERRWANAERTRIWQSHCRATLHTLGGVLTDTDVDAIVARRWEASRALEMVQSWSEHALNDKRAPRTLVLLGRPDTGKTFAAAAWLAVSSCPQGVRSRALGAAYVKEQELCRLKPMKYDPEAARYRALLDVDRLVVDEIDPQNNERDIAQRVLMDVLDERKGAGRMTIIAGNLTKKQLVEWRCDERVVSRLRALARIEVIVDKSRRPDLGYLPA